MDATSLDLSSHSESEKKKRKSERKPKFTRSRIVPFNCSQFDAKLVMAGASKAWGITGAKSNCETLYFARDVIYQQTTDVNKKKNQKRGK